MPDTIAENLQRLVDARADIVSAITAKGGTVDTGDGFEEFSADIATIPSGGDIQFSHRVGYTSSSSSYVTNSVNVYNPSSCYIKGTSTSSGYTSFMIPIITTNSNVFICLPVQIEISSSERTASVSYNIPSDFPSKFGYNASTMTLHSYYKSIWPTVTTANCTVGASTINFSLSTAAQDNFFSDFILRFDRT